MELSSEELLSRDVQQAEQEFLDETVQYERKKSTQISNTVFPSNGLESCFTCQGFPQSGWSDRVAHLALVHVGVILDYLQHCQLSTGRTPPQCHS